MVQHHLSGTLTVASQKKTKRKTKTCIAKAWMKTAFTKMGDKMPDTIKIHLSCYLNYRVLYNYMVEDLKAVGDDPVCYSQFCKLMETDFKEVSIPKVPELLYFNTFALLSPDK